MLIRDFLEENKKLKAAKEASIFLETQGDYPQDPHEFLAWLIETHLKSCSKCFLQKNRNNVVIPDGAALSPIMVVLEGPGFIEDLTKIPISGIQEIRHSNCGSCDKAMTCYKSRFKGENYRAKWASIKINCEPSPTSEKIIPDHFYVRSVGQIINGILIDKYDLEYPRHNWVKAAGSAYKSPWFFTNAVLCRSMNPETLGDTSPQYSFIKACSTWLSLQWAACQPKIVIGLGNAAMETLLKKKKSKAPINVLQESSYGPAYFNNHPAYYMRLDNEVQKAYGYASIAGSFDLALSYCGLIDYNEEDYEFN